MTSLLDMPSGEKGIISAIHGGYGLTQKLENMGFRIGKEIVKVNKQWRRGPIIVQSGNSQVALGHGIARRIMVEIQ